MTLATPILALTPFVGLGVCMTVHVILSRAVPASPHLRGIKLSVAAGAVVVAGLASFGAKDHHLGTVSALELVAVWLLTYLVLAYCYIIGFFNLGESARRIRLLIDLHLAGPRGLTLE